MKAELPQMKEKRSANSYTLMLAGARRSTGSWKNVWTSNFMKRWVGRRPWKGCSLAEMHTQNVHQALKSCGCVDMMGRKPVFDDVKIF
ncbi:hypothetical protein POPTR_014G045400v4 [Populus trichocarpa]|uniref:Uncharacterized protein n=1 Tax=Populus trichocarpa TaxID=3694 RepID=A0A3N7FXK0_POPTR|nr:hypothetical protein POPTR_014G045400v4 [Populus trichocarpa]